MKLVNANIESEREMFIRLFDGEVFDHGDCKIMFKDHRFVVVGKCGGGEKQLYAYATKFSEFMVEEKLIDRLCEDYQPLCWVSDFDKELKEVNSRIVSFDQKSKRYIGSNGHKWVYATPVEPSELDK